MPKKRKDLFKNILLHINGRPSKIRSVHTYAMTWTVYFYWICSTHFTHRKTNTVWFFFRCIKSDSWQHNSITWHERNFFVCSKVDKNAQILEQMCNLALLFFFLIYSNGLPGNSQQPKKSRCALLLLHVKLDFTAGVLENRSYSE